MKMLAFLFLTISCYAAEVRITDRIIPYVQDGGGTSTSITIVNLEQTAAAFEILFLTETGAFWPVTLADQGALISDGAYVRGTIAAGRSVTFQTANAGSQTRFGHAIINSLDNARFGLSSVTGDLTFNAAPEREDALTLAFDNTAGQEYNPAVDLRHALRPGHLRHSRRPGCAPFHQPLPVPRWCRSAGDRHAGPGA